MHVKLENCVNTVDAGLVSYGCWALGKSIFGAGVNSLLIVHKERVCRMFEITLRDL